MGPRFGFGWGTTFRDMDMDGFEDLLVTNGFNSCIDRPVMMINRAAEGDPRFIEQPSLVLNAIEPRCLHHRGRPRPRRRHRPDPHRADDAFARLP